MTELEKIGSEIKKRRKLLDITQETLADISGISLRSLKSIEVGKGNPGVEQLTKVFDALGLKLTIGVK